MGSEGDDLKLALSLAAEADSLTLSRFGALDLRVETKPDLTPVTDADHDVELTLRKSAGIPPPRRLGVSAKSSAAQRLSPAGSG